MKKFISILLSVVIAFSVSVAAFAAGDKDCDCGYVPVIYVTGFAQTDLVANAGTEDEYQVFFPNAMLIVQCVLKLVVPIVALVITGNYDSFAKSVSLAVNGLFSDVACDDSGTPLNSTVDIVEREEPSADHHAYTEHMFRYDWREDVFDIAAELNDYIEDMKDLTGHDKVALKGISMGGAVIMTYLSEYGYDSVDSVVMQSSAFNGISLITSLFTGDLDIQAKPVVNYICNFIEGNDPETICLRAMVKTLCSIVINPVASVLDNVIKQSKDRLYSDCFSDAFGNLPGIWVFVSNDSYEQAKDLLLDENENAELIKKIDKYHYGVMDRTKEILDEAIDSGVKLAIFSNYGKAAVPVHTNDDFQSDFLIDTTYTSFGATCAPINGSLGDDYVQAVNDGHNHISCDNVIDASTCAYPEYTWFIKDMMHTWFTSGYDAFTYWFIYSDTQQTVWSNPIYPQFLYNNQETGELEPLSEDNMNTQNTDVNLPALISQISGQIKK